MILIYCSFTNFNIYTIYLSRINRTLIDFKFEGYFQVQTVKDVQCYELFGGIALKNHVFSFFLQTLRIITIIIIN